MRTGIKEVRNLAKTLMMRTALIVSMIGNGLTTKIKVAPFSAEMLVERGLKRHHQRESRKATRTPSPRLLQGQISFFIGLTDKKQCYCSDGWCRKRRTCAWCFLVTKCSHSLNRAFSFKWIAAGFIWAFNLCNLTFANWETHVHLIEHNAYFLQKALEADVSMLELVFGWRLQNGVPFYQWW